MRATSIRLYSRTSAYEPAYCGSFHVPCPDGDGRIPDLDEVGCGRFRDENGMPCRAFFFADEIEEMVALAERTTGCYVEVDESWPHVSKMRCPDCGGPLEGWAGEHHSIQCGEVAAMRER